MLDQMHAFIAIASRVFAGEGPVCQFGARLATDDDERLAPLFPGREWIGIDQRSGAGVDRVEDYSQLSLADASVGTIVALEQIECTFDAPRLLDEMMRVLRPGGTLLIATMFDSEAAGSPCDYWRTTPGGLARLTASLEARLLGWQGPERRPTIGYCIGTKAPAPRGFGNDAEQFITAMNAWTAVEEAHIPWHHRLARKLLGCLALRGWQAEETASNSLRFAIDLPPAAVWPRMILPRKPSSRGASQSRTG